jgi:Rha family phage regulatory protein
MNDLRVIEQNGQLLIDSREVAEMVDKDHSNLMRDIRGYVAILENSKLNSQNFYIPSTYKTDGNNKTYDCFLLTRKGCDMVANKMTGEKGVLFTAAYVTKFEEMEIKNKQPNLSGLSPQLQYLIHLEQKQNEMEKKIDRIADGLTAVPDHTKVVERVNEYARYTRQDYNAIYNGIYKIMKAQHGIDVKARVENERRKINAEHYEKTGKLYAESTLKSKVNGIDVMVRMGVLDKFNNILVGLLAKAKGIA